MKLAFALALVACSKSAAPPQPSPSAAPAHPDAALVSRTVIDGSLVPNQLQMVTAIVPDWDSTKAELAVWVSEGTGWKRILGPWPGVVGANGTAWGRGAHGDGAPKGRRGPIKREGDGKSPAGIFTMQRAYGYATTAKSLLPYTPVDEHWKCVDDPKSASYQRVLDERTTKKDWTSAEEMRRGDDLYKWVVEVDHNASRTPGAGSCIFLHVWSGPKGATAGCTAMDEQHLATLIETIDATAQFVLLPRAEYDALAAEWNLPR